jgi:hypothetical protein
VDSGLGYLSFNRRHKASYPIFFVMHFINRRLYAFHLYPYFDIVRSKHWDWAEDVAVDGDFEGFGLKLRSGMRRDDETM